MLGFLHGDRTIPSSLAGDALSLFDDEVWQCFSECTTVDTPDPEQQAQISLSRGGVGLRLVSYHYSAKNLVSAIISDLSSEVIKHLNHSISTFMIHPTHLLLVLLITALPHSLRSSCQTKLRIASLENYLIALH